MFFSQHSVELALTLTRKWSPFPQIDIIGARMIVWTLEGKRETYQVCSQYCVQQMCTVQCTHTHEQFVLKRDVKLQPTNQPTHMNKPHTLSVGCVLYDWADFTVLRSCFVYVYFVLIICCSIVTWWGGPGGIEASSFWLLFPSVLLHCWLGHLTLTPKKLVPDMTCSVFSGMLNPAQSTRKWPNIVILGSIAVNSHTSQEMS